jgi:hypothetical protein
LIAARSLPVGARSFKTLSIAGSLRAVDAMPQASTAAMARVRIATMFLPGSFNLLVKA